MRLRVDERGQSIWIGFLLLLMLLMIVYALYQATIIPEQNAKIEFEHQLEMAEDMRHLRDRIYLAGSTGGTQSLTMDLGPDYPIRLIGLNPPAPSGRLHTVAKGNISMTADGSVVNLSSACGYQQTSSVRSRSIAFHINYNTFHSEPTIGYTHSALYKHVNDTYLLLDKRQTLISNTTVTLIPLTSSYSKATRKAVSIQFTPGQVGSMTVDANQTITLTIPTRLPASKWATLLSDQPAVQGVSQASANKVAIDLKPQAYTLACYPVGIEEAPPGGKRELGDLPEVTETTTTPTGTATPTSTPEPKPPNAVIENVTAVRERKGSTLQNRVTVNWSATDVNSDLDAVTIRVTDLNTSKTKSTTLNISGTSASGSFEVIFGRGQAEQGDTYRVFIVVVDEADHEDREEQTVTIG